MERMWGQIWSGGEKATKET